jgi:hypothetical protein
MNVDANKMIIERVIGKVPSSTMRDQLSSDLTTLLDQHAAAPDNQKPLIADQMAQLRKTAEIAAGMGAWSWFSISFISIITLGFFGAIFLYFKGLGPDRYSSIEATRPILVFTLIIAMLGFGGLLIVRALFSCEAGAELQNRFRLAREIFLVYAGIFGTIIGFYFGAADGAGSRPPSLGTPVFAAGRVSVVVEGGRAPFLGLFTPRGQVGGQMMAVADRTLSFEIPGCPADAEILVVDGEGRRAEAKVTCPAAPATNGNGAGGNGASGDVASGNAVNGNGTTPAP